MKIKMQVSADLVVTQLAGGLYRHPGRRFAEVMRNGVDASMVNPEIWEPKRAKIEVFLVKDHPLATDGEPVLIILNHGRGFTLRDFDGYFKNLGKTDDLLSENENGLFFGKGMGRLAAFAMNRKCMQGGRRDRSRHGYTLLTRVGKDGDVRCIPITAHACTEGDGVEVDGTIGPHSPKMKPFKGIEGSFTAIIIPTPIFQSYAQIYEAVKWYLPREQDKMFDLRFGGQSVQPPPLEDAINRSSADGQFRARLGVTEEANDGVWLCDSVTGFRVAKARDLGPRLIPEPFWYPEVVGDLFGRNFLRYQDTERESLLSDFTTRDNPDWRDFQKFLLSVAPDARKLIERDAISGDAAQLLDEVVGFINERYGPPPEKVPQPPRKPRTPQRAW